MQNHKCKSWKPFFDAIKNGSKKHDLRINDRNFKIGDIITLQSYDPFAGVYTGEELEVEITYITSTDTPCAFSSAVLDKKYCILSLELSKTCE
jgi:ASC-1-like (ASCH) protein